MASRKDEIIAEIKRIENRKAEIIAEINKNKQEFGIEPRQRVIDIKLKEEDRVELVIVTEQ
jgi:hypothetical protein